MIRYLLIPFLCFLALGTTAQENNFWFCPGNNTLDFNSNPPVSGFSPVKVPASGISAACNEQGALMFYTDGVNVYNRQHVIMKNGDSISDVSHASSLSIFNPPIVQFPNSDSLYYVFTTALQGQNLCYSVIDMSLDGGLGAVVEHKKFVFIDSDVRVGVVKAAYGAGCYTWLISHSIGTNEFRSYKIDALGIDTEAVVSEVGFFGTNTYDYLSSIIVLTKDAKRLFMSCGTTLASLESFSFDNSTGKVSDGQLLTSYGVAGRVHSIELSPDDTKLFMTGGPDGGGLIQFDLNSLPAIDTFTFADGRNINGQLKLGPDGKIYLTDWRGLFTIMNPNLKGEAAQLRKDYIQLPAGSQTTPHFLGSVFVARPTINATTTKDTISCDEQLELKIESGKETYLWSDGDTLNTKTISEPGSVWVKYGDQCYSITDTFNIRFERCNCKPYLPNAFSPNKDGLNDWFGIVGNDVETLKLIVYDRWGNQVFATTDPAIKWNGMYKADLCQVGAYYYYCEVKCFNGDSRTFKGDVLLLR